MNIHALKRYDIAIIIISIIGIALAFALPFNKQRTAHLAVYEDGIKKTYSLDNSEIEASTKYGKIKVKVEDEKVRITDATCHDKLCVRSGCIDGLNESIICLPGRIAVIIEPDKNIENSLDAIIK